MARSSTILGGNYMLYSLAKSGVGSNLATTRLARPKKGGAE
nr:MAG TPA: hypothetical protein [Caudoviricetes sp.]